MLLLFSTVPLISLLINGKPPESKCLLISYHPHVFYSCLLGTAIEILGIIFINFNYLIILNARI